MSNFLGKELGSLLSGKLYTMRHSVSTETHRIFTLSLRDILWQKSEVSVLLKLVPFLKRDELI